MRRPRIKRTTEEIETPEGDVYLLRPSADSDIRIEKPDGEERRLLAAVDGERTLEELRAEFGAKEVDDLIAQLQELEVVEDAADDELLPAGELARFDRQLRYFSDIGTAELTPSECQRRLREAKVAVLGVGGLGGWAAWALACCGVGEMWLIDGDRVEVSNLNRQILYTEADIGLLKVECAAARLRAFNSGARITAAARRLESEEEIAEFIAGSDVVIDAAD
ncbi:MAG TPA: ThiF family adenylyltransferase, partial [Solirubrobacterales bacterium]|nr:ThiF family adenylyltransferase [Solirubrobacterales bacterium]